MGGLECLEPRLLLNVDAASLDVDGNDVAQDVSAGLACEALSVTVFIASCYSHLWWLSSLVSKFLAGSD